MRTGFVESPLFEVDLERVARFNNGARPPDEHFNYHPTDREVIEYVDECIAAGEFGTDIETPEAAVDDDELDPTYITPVELVGLSARVGESVGVRPDQFDLIKRLFAARPDGKRLTCWTHNGGNFDYPKLRAWFDLDGIRKADTMLGMHLLWPHLTNKDAATCFSIFGDIPYYKNTRLIDPGFYNTVGNCRDTYGALWAGRNILRAMRQFPRMEDLFWNHMMGIVDWITEVRVKGTNCDTVQADRVFLTLMKTLEAYEVWWNKNIPAFSWSSPKQLINLFSQMGMPIFKRKREKKDEDGNKVRTFTPTCDDEALEEYVKRGNKTAALVQTMRGLKHAGDFMSIAKSDGRIHPRLKAHGQVGGRIQAVDGNVQTIPEELAGIYPREIVVPDDPSTQSIGCADYSQIELRLYAIQSGARSLLDRMATGDYIYGFFYEDIFGKPFFKAGQPRTKRAILPEIRPWEILVVKSWPLGFIYGRGIPEPTPEMIKTLGAVAARKRPREIHDRFHRENPEIKRFHTQLEFQASRTGYLISPFGRIRRFPNVKGAYNEILAFPGQSVAVDILIRNALRKLPTLLAPFGGRLLFPVHDSAVFQFETKYVREVDQVVANAMEAPLPELDNWAIPTERKYGPNWGKLTSLDKFIERMDPLAVGAVGDTQTAVSGQTIKPEVVTGDNIVAS
jgi:DNA polymerase I-like protein with 3'-5' exonuclease and polymerase domains